MARTYYEILGVTKETSDDEIKSCYRRLAIKYHPDKNPNDPTAADKFQELSLAYQVLGDSQKRKTYDEEVSASEQNRQSPGAAFTVASNDKQRFDLADSLRMFMDMFRTDRIFQRNFYRTEIHAEQNRGSNVQINVYLTLMEMMDGAKKKISVAHKKKCSACEGTGDSKKQTSHPACSVCNGQGKVRIAETNEIRPCAQCFGAGVVSLYPCPVCAGTGSIQGTTDLMVTFQKGISEGNYIFIPEMGNSGSRGSRAGDCILLIHEEKHPIFKRRGYDLEREIIISLLTAVQGGLVSVGDLRDQSHEVHINPGTNPGTLLCLGGFGLPYYKKERKGNLYIRINVEIPHPLSPQAQDAFQAFAAIVENELREKNYSMIGRFYVISVPEEQNIQGMQAALDTAKRFMDMQEPIALDLSCLSTITSSLIGRIIAIQRKLDRYSERLVLIGSKSTLQPIFHDCNLENLFIFMESPYDLESLEPPILKEKNADQTAPLIREQDGHWLIDAGTDKFNVEIFSNNEVTGLFAKPGISIGLDLRKVLLINSGVIGEMIKKYKIAKKSGGRFFLFGPRHDVLEILRQTNCDKLFEIVKNKHEMDALKPTSQEA
jgi:molecular chaperone DnaJ